MTILTAITCYIFLAATFATADTSLCFNEKIIFQDALIGKEDFTPTDQMNTDMTKALNVAVGNNAALTTQVYNAFPHLAVVASFWTTGTDNTVNSNIATLEKAFEQWSSPATSNTLYQNLNPVTNTYVGQQGRTIAVSEGCGNYVAMGMNSYTCLRNLSVTILTQSQTTGLQAALCNALNLGSCNLIELLKQDTEVITTAGAITGISTVKTYQRYAFNIYVQNREVGLASLVTRARYASALSSQRIAFVRVNGVQVYQSSDQASETVIGSTGQCAEKMWYLIFLLITIPIFIIATHRFYMYGNRSGKRTIAKQEQEIRASIHIQAATHMQPQQHGAFFMNNYLRSVSGYQAPQSVAPAAELQWIQGTDGQWYQVPAAPAPAPVVQQPTPQWVQTADGQWYMEDPNARIESWRQSTA